MLHKILGNSTEGNTINLARKFSIFSPKTLSHRIELPQDRYLNMRKPLNRTACARADLTRSKEHIYGASSDYQRAFCSQSYGQSKQWT